MKRFCVQRIEVYRQDILVDAKTPEQAKKLVALDNKGDMGELHYGYQIESDGWPVFEVL